MPPVPPPGSYANDFKCCAFIQRNMFSENYCDKYINIDSNYTFVSPGRLSPVTQQLLHV